MLLKRVIVSLDVRGGRVAHAEGPDVPGDLGDAVDVARRFASDGADEIVLFSESFSAGERQSVLNTITAVAGNLFVPLTVGGGIGSLEDVADVLQAGADKVAINTAAVDRPELIQECAERFGAPSIMVCIRTKVERRRGEVSSDPAGDHPFVGERHITRPWYRVYTERGQTETQRDAIVWAREAVERGAGEILVSSMDRAGRREGLDLELTARIAETVATPVIAAGGAGSIAHLRDAFLLAGADAVLAGGIFRDGTLSVAEVKRALLEEGISVRPLPGDAEPRPRPADSPTPL